MGEVGLGWGSPSMHHTGSGRHHDTLSRAAGRPSRPQDDFEEGSIEEDEEGEVPLPAADSFPVGSLVFALYDYEPEELSPNDDAVRHASHLSLILTCFDLWLRKCVADTLRRSAPLLTPVADALQDEELAFRERDLLKILKEMDADGFYLV